MHVKESIQIRIWLLLFSLVIGEQAAAQLIQKDSIQTSVSFWEYSPYKNPKRVKLVTGIGAGGYSALMLYMGTAWYAQEELGPFHFFNDWHEWKQMDKVGHVLGGYHQSRLLIDLYQWAGMPKKKALLIGGLGGFATQTSIEIFDGFAKKWGASVPDVAANALGSLLAVSNKAIWDEDRIQLKFSYKKSPFVERPDLERLFGTTWPEWVLKDYNGQTYWLSVNVHSFLADDGFKKVYPPWLNIALGYGAEGLEGGYDPAKKAEINAREYRQFYLGLDIDLSRIPVKQKWLKTIFSVLNVIHIPAPALQMDKNGLKFKPFH